LVDDIISGGSILMLKIREVLKRNTLFVVTNLIKESIDSRGITPLFIFLEFMIQNRRVPF
jgi:hypothetical protein